MHVSLFGRKNKWFLSRVSLILCLSFSLSFSISLRLFIFFPPISCSWLFTEKTLDSASEPKLKTISSLKIAEKTGIKSNHRRSNFPPFSVDSRFFLCCVSVAWLAKYILVYASISCGESANRLFDELPCIPSGIRLYYSPAHRQRVSYLWVANRIFVRDKSGILELMNLSSSWFFFFMIYFSSPFFSPPSLFFCYFSCLWSWAVMNNARRHKSCARSHNQVRAHLFPCPSVNNFFDCCGEVGECKTVEFIFLELIFMFLRH